MENMDNINEDKNVKFNFLNYTKTRQSLGLNKKNVDEEVRRIEYLKKKQMEISNKIHTHEIKESTLNVARIYLDDEEYNDYEKKYDSNILETNKEKKRLNNGLAVGNGFSLTKEYLENKNLTNEEKYYNYVYNSNSSIVTKVRENGKKEKKEMEQKEIFLSEEGYKKLEEELKYLKTEERDAITERMKIAKSYGDLSENGEYDEAKSAQERNESRIAELEYMLTSATIIDDMSMGTDVVGVGNTVYITNISNNKELKYTIVGTAESNILEGKISNESPIAKSLLNSKVGDIVQVEAPAGIIEYKIKKITF